MTDILLIGHGAREHVIAETLMRSKHSPRMFSYLKSRRVILPTRPLALVATYSRPVGGKSPMTLVALFSI